MKPLRNLSILCVFVLAFSRLAYAPIFGLFPGLDKLIEHSTEIAIITIREERFQQRSGLWDNYLVRVEKVISGGLPEGKDSELPLRSLPLSGGPKGIAASGPAQNGDLPHPEIGGYIFEVGSRYLVFYGKNQFNDVALASLNYEGSQIPLYSGKAPGELKGKTPKEVIENLLKDDMAIRRKDLKNAEWRMKRYLGS